ncbi:hypothetical protein KSP39_PZI018166 [Platanthera zijinensis]|uniref:Uncharacterized protein n=1 Tax=Platanthera zijinensis TaxID=2320716 RepID=A0AAP0B494_9ASPA
MGLGKWAFTERRMHGGSLKKSKPLMGNIWKLTAVVTLNEDARVTLDFAGSVNEGGFSGGAESGRGLCCTTNSTSYLPAVIRAILDAASLVLGFAEFGRKITDSVEVRWISNQRIFLTNSAKLRTADCPNDRVPYP